MTIQEELIIKMSISEKIKIIDNKIQHNKDQYDLDRQTAKTSALSSRNISIYGFLNSKDVLPEKGLLEKVAALKRFEYSLLGKDLKTQTSVAEKRYQRLNKLLNHDEKEELVTIKKEKAETTD